jgi:hypothetical protein
MSFLRRLFGGEPSSANGTRVAAAPPHRTDPAAAEDEERAYELDLLREEGRRLDDLQQRQLRYADRAWTPPAQGGERRADDEDAEQPEG